MIFDLVCSRIWMLKSRWIGGVTVKKIDATTVTLVYENGEFTLKED